MRGVGCYSNLSKNSKEEGRKGRTTTVLYSGTNLCGGSKIAWVTGVSEKRRSQMCLQSVPLAWLDTKVS
jgi:hypothetical protein